MKNQFIVKFLEGRAMKVMSIYNSSFINGFNNCLNLESRDKIIYRFINSARAYYSFYS